MVEIADDEVLNLAQAAKFCEMSVPTFKTHLVRDDEELRVPISSFGRNGRSYEFVAGELKDWKIKLAAAEEAARQKQEQVNASLFGLDELPPDPIGLSLKQRNELIDHHYKEHRLAVARGSVVPYEDAEAAMTGLAGAMVDLMTWLEDELERRLGLDAEASAKVQALFGEARQGLADRVAELSPDAPTAGHSDR